MIKVDRNSKGFTLIELLIVIAIIGILAAIAIPAYTGYTKKSKLSGVTSAMGALKNAVIAYYTEKGSMPTATIEKLDNINNNFGIRLPSQYIADTPNTNVSSTGNQVNISVEIKDLATGINGELVNLGTTNIVTGATWTYDGGTNVKSLLPKQ